ncbi:MAG: prepilin-type N-terminal cleavage/methylation domain-containing protein [Candidatus Paceibacteria bacterium]|jgi:prepilin-type N-terminal cleavage/methylation domain-containing protein
MKNITTTKGFTLIELLVVISIIGLLSSVVLASLGEVRTKAAISSIQQEGIQLRTALELYRSKNGEYPIEGTLNNLTTGADSISLKLSEEIPSAMDTLREGVPGVSFDWDEYGHMFYVNTETYGGNSAWLKDSYCEGATIDAPYKVVFKVISYDISKFEGKFPKLLDSTSGRWLAASSGGVQGSIIALYCAFVPPN